ncbi:uncharacterized protein LOC126373952 isoform X5 [Pectinophora gossypiella]|nr:uncharacterized protein LOC126373952 isoform X5 [Pectinophora gossypiella]
MTTSQQNTNQELIPTAACIVSNVSKERHTQGKDTILCCLCGKNNHVIFQCTKANSMTLEEKMNSIKKSGFCFICLKKGHLANKCKTFTKCLSCHKRHNVILCPNVHKTESTLFTKHNETFLQTLIVTVSYNGRNMKVRALLDSGSQRSYVKSSVAKELKLEKGLSTAETPDLDVIDAHNMNIRLRYLQTLRTEFRQRFRNEYISLLISKNKGKSKFPSVGDVVLIQTDAGRLYWPLGIIKELVTGNDGITRVAKVQTAMGEKIRSCQRLYPLELSAVTDEWHTPTVPKQGEPDSADLRAGSSCVLDPTANSHIDETPAITVGDESHPSSTTTRHGRVVKLPRRFLD